MTRLQVPSEIPQLMKTKGKDDDSEEEQEISIPKPYGEVGRIQTDTRFGFNLLKASCLGETQFNILSLTIHRLVARQMDIRIPWKDQSLTDKVEIIRLCHKKHPWITMYKNFWIVEQIATAYLNRKTKAHEAEDHSLPASFLDDVRERAIDALEYIEKQEQMRKDRKGSRQLPNGKESLLITGTEDQATNHATKKRKRVRTKESPKRKKGASQNKQPPHISESEDDEDIPLSKMVTSSKRHFEGDGDQ